VGCDPGETGMQFDIEQLVNIGFYPLVLTWSSDSPRSQNVDAAI
jgi:hypothetical protein